MISNQFDQYWSLDRYDELSYSELLQQMQDQGINITRNYCSDKKKLVKVYHRYQRGQICYDQYSDRQLAYSSNSSCFKRDFNDLGTDRLYSDRDRNGIIQEFQRKDNRGSTFAKFMELPAELRLFVIEFYIDALPDTLRMPVSLLPDD